MRTLGLRKGLFMLPSGVPPQPPRQPSEAAYGSSGRPREVGAILRRTPTFVTITAQPSPPVRRERALTSRHGTTAAAGRYTPTGLPAIGVPHRQSDRLQKASPKPLSLIHTLQGPFLHKLLFSPEAAFRRQLVGSRSPALTMAGLSPESLCAQTSRRISGAVTEGAADGGGLEVFKVEIGSARAVV